MTLDRQNKKIILSNHIKSFTFFKDFFFFGNKDTNHSKISIQPNPKLTLSPNPVL